MNLSLDPVSPNLARCRTLAGLHGVLQKHGDVQRLLEIVESNRKHWAVVGGAPRHWALDVPGDPSDLDIVVGMPPAMLGTVVERWRRAHRDVALITTTALGGYRLNSDTWSVDLWSIVRTVGVANGQVVDSKSFRAVARSAALSLDSMVVTSRGTLYERGFFATMRTGILRMNHCTVERPHKVAEKALRLCGYFRLVPDLSVQAFIASALGTDAVEELFDTGAYRTEP